MSQHTTHLQAVPDNDLQYDVVSEYGIPSFEGQKVDGCRAKLTSASKLEIDTVSRVDDVVRLFVEGVVTGVGHIVDEQAGRLMRVHTIKVVEVVPLPQDFDPTAPNG